MENVYIIISFFSTLYETHFYSYICKIFQQPELIFEIESGEKADPANISFGNLKEKWAIFSMMTFSCRSASYLFYVPEAQFMVV
jgi:hypothetical protein